MGTGSNQKFKECQKNLNIIRKQRQSEVAANEGACNLSLLRN